METQQRKPKPKHPHRLQVMISEPCKALLTAIRLRQGISEGAAVELGVRAYAAVNGISADAQASQAEAGGE